VVLKQACARQRCALHDHITGLPNATLFKDRLKNALAQARRHSWQVAVMFIDLDGFKEVNDVHGHDVGDAVLRMVAERLQSFVRGGDTVSRRSGDEFLFLMLEAKDADNARTMAQRIIEMIAAPAVVNGIELSVQASIGLAMFPGDGTTPAVLLKQADAAMYEAKRLGSESVLPRPPRRGRR
jgi:diguanylate cyclase (GGDEF)-like protein